MAVTYPRLTIQPPSAFLCPLFMSTPPQPLIIFWKPQFQPPPHASLQLWLLLSPLPTPASFTFLRAGQRNLCILISPFLSPPPFFLSFHQCLFLPQDSVSISGSCRGCILVLLSPRAAAWTPGTPSPPQVSLGPTSLHPQNLVQRVPPCGHPMAASCCLQFIGGDHISAHLELRFKCGHPIMCLICCHQIHRLLGNGTYQVSCALDPGS